MKKRIVCALTALMCALSLCACAAARPFEKEYYSESDYIAPQSGESGSTGISVRSYARLKGYISQLVAEGQTEGRISFDSNYDGDIASDLASACWELRTQNALCAYCVENISYELSKIVTSYEADVVISYASSIVSIEDIIRRQYFTGVDSIIRQAFENGDEHVALYIGNCTRSAQNVILLADEVYYANPLITPTKPDVEVNTFGSGGLQRLFEINIDYNVDAQTMEQFRESVDGLTLWETKPEGSAAELALYACRYLTESCALTSDTRLNSAYYALVRHEADSEGIALAYSELCRRLGVKCQIVHGKLDWEEHCWNIVRIDGASYHVDVCECMKNGIQAGFLHNDEYIWGRYRWDTASYPECSGTLGYGEIVAVG